MKIVESDTNYEVELDERSGCFTVSMMRNCGNEIIKILHKYKYCSVLSYCQGGLNAIASNSIDWPIKSITHYFEGGKDISLLANTKNKISHIGLILDNDDAVCDVKGGFGGAQSILIKSKVARRITVNNGNVVSFRLVGAMGGGGVLDLSLCGKLKCVEVSGGVVKLKAINISGLEKLQSLMLVATKSLSQVIVDDAASRINLLVLGGIKPETAIQLAKLRPKILSLWDTKAFESISAAAVYYGDSEIRDDRGINDRAGTLLENAQQGGADGARDL